MYIYKWLIILSLLSFIKIRMSEAVPEGQPQQEQKQQPSNELSKEKSSHPPPEEKQDHASSSAKQEEPQTEAKKQEAPKQDNPSKDEPKAQDKTQEKKQSNKQQRGRRERHNKTGYLLMDRKEIPITKRQQDRTEQAKVVKQIAQALFGGRRFKNIVLTCSLNHLYHCLHIANTLHRRVQGLHLIISLESVKFVQFSSEEDPTGQQKEHSIFHIKLTKFPTEDDLKHVGYNAPHSAAQISNPITRNFIIERREKRERSVGGRDRRKRDNRREEDVRDVREDRGRRQKNEREGGGRYDERNRYPQDRQDNRDRKRTDRSPQKRQRRQKDERQEIEEKKKKRYEPKVHPKEQHDHRKKYEEKKPTRRDERDDRHYQHKRYEEKKDHYDNRPSYKDRKEPQYKAKPVRQEAEEREGRRGELKSRGTGKVAAHNYDSSHLRRNQERGDRKPNRDRRYSEDSD